MKKHFVSNEELEKDILEKFKNEKIVELKLLSSVRGKPDCGHRYFLLKNDKGKYALAVIDGNPIYKSGVDAQNVGTTYFCGFDIRSKLLTNFEFDEIIAESYQDDIFYLKKDTKWFLAKYNGYEKEFFSKSYDKIELINMRKTVYKLYNNDYYDVLDLEFQYLLKNCPTFEDKSQENAYFNKKFYKEEPFYLRQIKSIIPYLVKLIDGIDVVLEEYTTPIIKNGKEIVIMYLTNKTSDNLAKHEIENRMSVFSSPYWISNKERELLEKQVLLTPADNYVQLSYYKRFDNPNYIHIYFRHNYGEYDFPLDYDEEVSKICDERFSYIIDFMALLVEKKFEKENFCLELDEIEKLALEFANNYKKDKTIVRARKINEIL